MAVQKSRKSKSKRNIRKSANSKFKLPAFSFDQETSEMHLRHFITETGYYKGKQVLKKKMKKVKNNINENEAV